MKRQIKSFTALNQLYRLTIFHDLFKIVVSFASVWATQINSSTPTKMFILFAKV